MLETNLALALGVFIEDVLKDTRFPTKSGCAVRAPKVFDGYLPLGAVEASDRSRHMGIGLSVCRAIVRAHGGEIYARNKIDGGAEFRFWLPAEEESNT